MKLFESLLTTVTTCQCVRSTDSDPESRTGQDRIGLIQYEFFLLLIVTQPTNVVGVDDIEILI